MLEEEREYREPVLKIVAENLRCVLIGRPGSGKSTFARFLTLCMAGDLLRKPQENLDRLNRAEDDAPPVWTHGALLPIFVELRHFAPAATPCFSLNLRKLLTSCSIGRIRPNPKKTLNPYLPEYL